MKIEALDSLPVAGFHLLLLDHPVDVRDLAVEQQRRGGGQVELPPVHPRRHPGRHPPEHLPVRLPHRADLQHFQSPGERKK